MIPALADLVTHPLALHGLAFAAEAAALLIIAWTFFREILSAVGGARWFLSAVLLVAFALPTVSCALQASEGYLNLPPWVVLVSQLAAAAWDLPTALWIRRGMIETRRARTSPAPTARARRKGDLTLLSDALFPISVHRLLEASRAAAARAFDGVADDEEMSVVLTRPVNDHRVAHGG